MSSFTRIRAVSALLAMVALSGAVFVAVAIADDISNTLDTSVDATPESMALTAGGPKGTTQVRLEPRGGDGKNGCNIQATDPHLVASVQSSNPAVASVSPSSVTFANCGDLRTLTVTPISEGSATITLTRVSNNTVGTFDLAPATFTVNVGAGAVHPVAGKSFVAQTVRGSVDFKCKGDQERHALGEATSLPVGCLIDTRGGRVEITSAANASSTKTKSAVVYDGQFKVREKRSKRPVTEFRLAGKLEGCTTASAAGGPVREARRRRRGRRLWGRGRGRFRTRGRHSSASVRGTTWLVADRCDGSTLTKVRSGKVKVRDFVKRKTITLKKGQSYVAKPRKRHRR
jgi:hypothetical protein